MQIKILVVDSKHVQEGKKDYVLLDVSYKNLDFNKVEGKKIVSFASPDVFKALKEAKAGDEFTVTKGEKTATGHVPWTRIVAGLTGADTSNSTAEAAPTKPGNTSTPRSTYETPEERAKKQVYIVRQSSIANAIATFALSETHPTRNEVIDCAKVYEAYVFGSDPMKEIMDMEDDVPL